MNFGKLLEAFKNNETDVAENVIIVINDDILRNALLAWGSMVIDYDSEEECNCDDSKRQWEWMWSKINIDYRKFSLVANVKQYEAAKLIERLKSLRLIYPDGTVNNVARVYLRKMVTDKLPKMKNE